MSAGKFTIYITKLSGLITDIFGDSDDEEEREEKKEEEDEKEPGGS